MAMLVVLRDARSNLAVLDAATAGRLASLGVTHVTVARDTTTEAVVLEGWAFDVARSAAEATSAIGGDAATRALQPVLQTLLTPDRGLGADSSERQPPSPHRATSGSSTGGSP
jgi:hypothetical protein